MKYTDNLGLKKPESTDFYNVDDFNDNMDKIEEELEKRPTDDGDASSMTIEFTEALETATLTSGEKLSVAFGKIARAIRGYMSHILIKGSSSQSGHVKLTDSSAVTDTTGLALAATEKNASIGGTLANQISALNNNLNNKDALKVLKSDWSGHEGIMYAQFNRSGDNVNDIVSDRGDGTYPPVRVARAYNDGDGNNIKDTYLKKTDATINPQALSNSGVHYNAQTPVLQYFTVPNDGYYLIACLVQFAANANGHREIFITNTSTGNVVGRVRVPAISGEAQVLQVISGVPFAPGESGTLSSYQNSGADINVQAWTNLTRIAPKK